jgi:threonine dehydratase
MAAAVTLSDIAEARGRITSSVVHAPLVLSPSLSKIARAPIALKLENRQATGSFKLRGATNAVLKLEAAEAGAGLVTASTGNHGQALAYAAHRRGARVTICMSALVPANKVEAIRSLGADIRIVGMSQDDAMREVSRLVLEEGMLFVPPFDHPDIVAGQGTIGLEIIEDMPDVALVLVPLSGGGLAAGLAAAIKAKRPQARVIGISMERGAAMAASLAAGRPVEVEEQETLADSLGGGIGLDNALTFSMCRDLLDDVILLTEGQIADGIRHAAVAEGQVVEGAGAVGIAALLAGKVKVDGPTALILSGGNIDPERHRAILGGANVGTV